MSQIDNLAQSAKDHAADISAQATDAAKNHISAHAEDVKHQAADRVQNAANAAEAASAELDPASPQAQAMAQVADHIEDAAARLRDADLGRIAAQTTDFARKNPLLFVGGAALAGFALARFLKAREPRDDTWAAHDTMGADPWGLDAPAHPSKERTHG